MGLVRGWVGHVSAVPVPVPVPVVILSSPTPMLLAHEEYALRFSGKRRT
jgi:hypothetical protein